MALSKLFRWGALCFKRSMEYKTGAVIMRVIIKFLAWKKTGYQTSYKTRTIFPNFVPRTVVTMGKRRPSGLANAHDGVVKKKPKSDDTKRFPPKSSNAAGKKVDKKSSKKPTESQESITNFWWHSKKVKTIKTSDGKAEKGKAKASLDKGPKLDIGSPGGKSVKLEDAVIGKKKALQLKKKRQRKNRLLRKRLEPGRDGIGDPPRTPKSWGNPKSLKRTGLGKPETGRNGHVSNKTNSVNDRRTSSDSGSISKDAKNGADAALDPQGSCPKPRRRGGQKECKRKKARKSSDAGEETRMEPKAAAGSAEPGKGGGRHVKKAKNGKPFAASGTRSRVVSNETETDGGRVGEVSSNWKALLPIVAKSKESDAKRRKKFGKRKTTSEKPTASKPDIWFDDVDPSLVRANENIESNDTAQSETGYNPLIRKDSQDCLTKCLAMDCEMVGTGPKGSASALARVSVVNQFGACVFDKYVQSREPVTDYRTFVSGIRPQDLRDKGEDFQKVQKELSDLLKGRIVVGHALHNDFRVLYFSHPRSLIRDTSGYQPFKDLFKSKRPGLKKLTELLLKVKVQKGEHNSVEDAQAAMKLYLLHRQQWEKSLRKKKLGPTAKKTAAKKPTAEALV